MLIISVVDLNSWYMTTEFDFKTIQISLLDFNKGQLDGLPKNPRFFRDYRYDAMKKSIEDSPEMLNLRELIVYPVGERYIVVCGNLRLRACKELGYKELPCKVLNPETPVKKLREYATKDNVSFGENDMDVMMNDWDKSELQDWGIEFAPEPEKDEFKERFEAITDETAVYPLIPKYDEKYELPFGAIIGSVVITDCVQNHPSVWAEKDCWNWVLKDAVLFDKPIMNVKGKLSFWDFKMEETK